MAMFARNNPRDETPGIRPGTPRFRVPTPSLNSKDALGGVNWDDYRQQGPERNPKPPAEPEKNVALEWRTHLNQESAKIYQTHRDAIHEAGRGIEEIHARIENDPRTPHFNHLQGLLSDTYPRWQNEPSYQPLGLMRSERWTYNKGEAEEEQAGLDKLSHVTSRRSLPKGYSVHVGKTGYGVGEYKATLSDKTQQVGHVTWNGETGYVDNLSIPEERHRPMLAHLLDKAHKVSHENGDTGPSHSDSLSAYSYKLMKKYAPSFITELTSVEDEDAPMYEGAAYAHQNAAQEARAQWNIAKPHLLNASTNNPLARVRVTEHEKMMRHLESLTKQGRLLEAQSHAQDVGHSNANLLYRAFPETHPRQVAEALAKSGGHIGKIVGNDFYDELYS
jgi:hypothetical protein